MLKRITAISVAALALTAAVSVSASAQTDGSTWRGPDGWRESGVRWHDGAYGYAASGYGYYLNAPNYPYAPQGGNSGGANFPHSGT